MVSGQNAYTLVQNILAFLDQVGSPPEQTAGVLWRCLSYVRNKKMMEDIAREMELSLSGFQTNENLEIYYDIGKAGRTIAYISKGWEDPGFRIGDMMVLDERSLDAFRRKSDKVLNVCATQGIACGAHAVEGDKLQLDFSICIYQEGFNAPTFARALETFEMGMNKVRSLLSE